VDRVTLTIRARLPRFHSCVRPIRYKKYRIKPIFHPATATPECEGPLAKIQSKANLQCSRQGYGQNKWLCPGRIPIVSAYGQNKASMCGPGVRPTIFADLSGFGKNEWNWADSLLHARSTHACGESASMIELFSSYR